MEYQRLFEQKEINFDKAEPFESLTEANGLISSYIEELDQLIAFKANFNIEEYKKSLVFNEINNQILQNESLLNSILVSNLYDPILSEQLNLKNSKITQYVKLLELKEDELISKETILEFFDDEQRTKYELLENQINAIDKDLGDIGLIISNLVLANETVWAHYQDALKNDQLSGSHCPLCNSDFNNIQDLTESYEKQIDNLKKFNEAKIDEKQKFLEELKQFHIAIKIKIEEYFKSNNTTEDSIITLLRNYPNLQTSVDSIKERFFKADLGFSEELILSSLPNNISEFDDKRSLLKTYLQGLISTQFKYDVQKIQNKELFSTHFDNDEQKLDLMTIDLLEQKKTFYLLQTKVNIQRKAYFFKGQIF